MWISPFNRFSFPPLEFYFLLCLSGTTKISPAPITQQQQLARRQMELGRGGGGHVQCDTSLMMMFTQWTHGRRAQLSLEPHSPNPQNGTTSLFICSSQERLMLGFHRSKHEVTTPDWQLVCGIGLRGPQRQRSTFWNDHSQTQHATTAELVNKSDITRRRCPNFYTQ